MSQPRRAPVHVCASCGVVDEAALDALQARDEQIERQREDIANLESELRSKRSKIKAQRRAQEQALREMPTYDDAIAVLEHWKKVCSPSARELSGIRLEKAIARLNAGYSKADLCRAIDGYSLKPYVVGGKRTYDGPKDAWRADAELIFRDASKVDQGLAIAERADDLRGALDAATPDANSGVPSGASATVPRFVLSDLGEGALRAASKGLLVFPCKPRDKAPATRHGFREAKRDPDAIRACWTKHPDFNVGVATGAGSGIVVLDVDTDETDEGEDGMASLLRLEDLYEELPDTLSVKTPRGGVHYWFEHPGHEIRNTTGYPETGLDVRGDGGYVLIPPSVGSGGRAYAVDEAAPIAPLPAWLNALLRDRQVKEDSVLAGGMDWGEFINDGASQGDRDNRAIRYVGHMLTRHPAKEVLAHLRAFNTANVKPPLPEKDLIRLVQSGVRMHGRKT